MTRAGASGELHLIGDNLYQEDVVSPLLKGQILIQGVVKELPDINISPINSEQYLRTLRTLGLVGKGILTRVFLGLHSGSCLQMLILSPEEQVCGVTEEEERSDVTDSMRGGWVRSSE